MYCRICRGEFREGIEECPVCGEPLAEQLTKEETKPDVARLPAAATLGIAGTALMFVIRTVSTFVPTPDLIAARLMSSLYLLSYVAVIAFFVVFLAEAVKQTQLRLKVATCVVLAGCVAAAAIVALNLLVLFDRPIVFAHPLGAASTVVSLLLPATSVLFFAAFLADRGSSSSRVLKAARLALVGALLSAAAHAVAAVLVHRLPMSSDDVGRLPALLGFPIVLFAVGTWLYFLWLIRGRAN